MRNLINFHNCHNIFIRNIVHTHHVSFYTHHIRITNAKKDKIQIGKQLTFYATIRRNYKISYFEPKSRNCLLFLTNNEYNIHSIGSKSNSLFIQQINVRNLRCNQLHLKLLKFIVLTARARFQEKQTHFVDFSKRLLKRNISTYFTLEKKKERCRNRFRELLNA